ncbi:hypothetical protein [Pseudonocardia endophytica]|uniref:Uncharacterized protein n=1 Tax=Pseudonocardia endophytica TaxID=401976 RepID=A0A4R1HUY5_PSEEN|nr:hypothetical protein [Pseudonocardia endophytica]TCK25183.1 hypothetical protein EV378_0981 [Pseudonocardia endophytica]
MGDDATPPDGGAAGHELPPGGPQATARGCLCSVLANAAYRSGADENPCIDPLCPLHAEAAAQN